MVAGCPRSGSTVLAKVLAFAPNVGYVEEPFNSQSGMIGTHDRFFPYIYEGSSYHPQYDRLLNNILSGEAHYKENILQPPTINPFRLIYRQVFTNRYQIRYRLDCLNPNVDSFVLKDPTATFSTEHFRKHQSMQIVYTLRHPAGTIASHLRLQWIGTPIQDFLNDPALTQYFSEEVRSQARKELSTLEGLAWYWRAINEYILDVTKRHPDIPIVEHETFSYRPVETSEKLYRRLNIAFTDEIASQVTAITSAENPVAPTDNEIHVLKRNSRANAQRWKKLLSSSEQKTIESICGETYKRIRALPNILGVITYIIVGLNILSMSTDML